MAKKKGEKQTVSRNYQIPGCQTHICSRSEGINANQFVAIAFNIAASNPDAKVAFELIIKDPNSDD